MAQSEGGGFVAGFFTGSLVGAGLALLLVPQTGEETRDLLRAKAREASNAARDAAGDVFDRGRSILDQARANLDDAVEEGKAAAGEERSRLESERLTFESGNGRSS
jgi:gas vesicle protein